MPSTRKNRGTRKSKKTTTRKVSTYNKKTSKEFKKKVISVLQGRTEDKQMILNPDPVALNPSLALATDLKQIVPALTLGTGNNQRIGDRVQGKSLNIRGHLELATNQQNSDGPTRVVVRLMVLSDKTHAYYGLGADTDWLNNLIDYGTGQNIVDGMQGGATNLRSMYLPINRNVATVHYDKLHYLTAPRVFNNTALQMNSINWEKTIKMFNINIKCKKVLKFIDDSNYPTNFAPYLCACFFQMNGGSNTTNYVRLHYLTKLNYEDA